MCHKCDISGFVWLWLRPLLFWNITRRMLMVVYRPVGTVAWSHLLVYWTAWPLKMGRTGCPETSVNNYQHTLLNIAEKRKPHVYYIFDRFCSVFAFFASMNFVVKLKLNHIYFQSALCVRQFDNLVHANIGLEILAATEFNKIFSGRQLRQSVKVVGPFRDCL
jgi:hypothetical protein